MSFFSSITYKDKGSLDAFNRLRVGTPTTLFDSKQVFDDQGLFWENSQESGSGGSNSYDGDRSSTTLTSTLSTATKMTRRTYQRFNYQPGKSQLILMTCVIDKSGGGTGVDRRVGMFDDDNGLFFHDDEGTVKVVCRSSTSGSAVDTSVAQTSWNIDVMDGTGPSGKSVDWSKTQILVMDFEWLGVGRVRFGLNIDGVTYYVHEFLNANVLDVVYMTTPNLPLTYQLETTASGAASGLECICATVISEGGSQDTGTLRYKSNDNTVINANTAGTIYALIGIRLKTTDLGCVVKMESVSVLATTNDDFEWLVILNPTVANAVTFGNESSSCVQTAVGNAGNPSNSTLTGGTILDGGYADASSGQKFPLENALRLGVAIDGTRDEIYLGVRPFSANADVVGSIQWRELS